MATTTLEIKISALVEGLKDVAALGMEFLKTAQSAKEIGDAGTGFDTLAEKATSSVDKIKEAFDTLGGRTVRDINLDILGVAAALEGLKNSDAPIADIAKAESEAAAETAKLNAELSTPTASTFLDTLKVLQDGLDSVTAAGADASKGLSEALDILGHRSLQEITDEIAKVKEAFEQVKEVGSFEEITNAAKLTDDQLKSLGTELDNLKIVATPAGQALADALNPEEKQLAIIQEIKQVEEALNRIKDSGASFDTINAAADLAARKLEPLKAAYQDLTTAGATAAADLEKAFSVLGARSTDAIKKEIADVEKALSEIKNSGAPFEEIARASELARYKIEQLNHELDSEKAKTFKERFSSIVDAIGKGNFSDAIQEINGLMEGLTGVERISGRVLVGFLAFKAIKFAQDLVGEFIALAKEGAVAAAKLETMGVTLNVVGRNAGYSEETLEKETKGLEKLGITAQSARESLVKMIQSGISITEMGDKIDAAGNRLSKAGELARAAQDLAVTSGQNSSDTLVRLITNIEHMSVVGLRLQGIIINQNTAQEKFASTLGVSSSALTESQKKMAFQAAALEEINKLSGAYVEAMDTAGKKQQSLLRYQEEYTAAIGKPQLAAYGAIIDAQTAYLSRATKIIENFNETTLTSKELGDAVKKLSDGLVDLAVAGVQALVDALPKVIVIIANIGESLASVISMVNRTKETLSELGKAFNLPELGGMELKLNPLTNILGDLVTLSAVLSDATKLLAAGWDIAASAALYAAAAYTLLKAKVRGVWDDEQGNKLKAEGEGYLALANKLRDTAVAGLSADSALNSLGDKTKKAGEATEKAKVGYKELSKEIEDLSALQKKGGPALELTKGYDEAKKKIDELKVSGKATTAEIGKLESQLASIPGAITKDYDEAAAKTKISLKSLQDDVTESVAAGANQLGEFLRSFATNQDLVIKNTQSSVETSSRDFLLLFEKVTSGAKTFNDFKTITQRANEAVQQGVLKQADLAKAVAFTRVAFDKVIETQTKLINTREEFDKFTEGVKRLGQVGAEGATAFSVSQEKIKESVQLAATAMIDNEAKLVSTRTELSSVISDIQKFGREGTFSSEKVSQETNKVTEAFLNLKLKAATTHQDFRDLAEIWRVLGATGQISTARMIDGLEKIAEAATGSKARLKELSDQSVALADAGVKLASSKLGVATAEVDVAKKRVDLWIAQNAYARSGSDIDGLALRLAEIDLTLANDRLELARLRFQEESAGYDLLIAKQKQLNAVTALQFDGTNDKLLKARDAADKEVLTQTLLVNEIKKTVDAKQESVTNTEIAEVKAKGELDVLKSVTAESQKMNQSLGLTGQALDSANTKATTLSKTMGGMSNISINANFADNQILSGFKRILEQAATYQTIKGKEIITSVLDISAAYSKVEEAMMRAQNSELRFGTGFTASTRNIISEGINPVIAGLASIATGYTKVEGSEDAAFASGVNGTREVSTALDNLVSKQGATTSAVTSSVKSMAGAYDSVTGAMVRTESSASTFGAGVVASAQSIVSNGLDPVIDGLASIDKSYAKVEGSENAAFQAQINGTQEVSTAIDVLTAKQKAYNDSSAAGFGLQKGSGGYWDDVGFHVQKTTDAVGAATAQLDKFNAELQSTKPSDADQRLIDSMAQMNAASASAKQGYDDLGEAASHFSLTAEQAFRNVAADIGDMITMQRTYNGLLREQANIPLPQAGGSSTGNRIEFAEGGKIVGPGTGTSDSVLMWGSNGEYVLRQAAVAHYGEALIDRMNNLTLPKAAIPGFAAGGMIGNQSVVATPATDTSRVVDHVAVDLNIAGEKVSLFGSRNQVNKFVDALRRTEVA